MKNTKEFVQQLATWTEDVIEHGRTPFRRVDSFPEIDTASGPFRPDLVFWINRQSLMAGGVLLLAHDNLEQRLIDGSSCATALGLNFFVTWEPQQIRIWQIEGEDLKENQKFPLTNPDQPETFKLLLHDLLNTLKLLAVLKAIPPHELPCSYFRNLFRMTLEQTQPSYTKAVRSSRCDADGGAPLDSDQRARAVNRLTLLQILALLWQRRLAATLLPDNLEETLRQELLLLPQDLRSGLFSAEQNAIVIPSEASVFFHHLILRLRQLTWTDSAERIKASFRGLIGSWFPLAATANETGYVLHPRTPVITEGVLLVLSQSQLLLAATALLRRIEDVPPCALKLGHIVELNTKLNETGQVHVYLSDDRNIVKAERQHLVMQLRLSWPSRRYKIATGQPLWIWEAVHLIGLCAPASELHLELPEGLAKLTTEHPLWEMLAQTSLRTVSILSGRALQLQLQKSSPDQGHYQLHLNGETFSLPRSCSPRILRNQLLLARHLPGETFALLGRAFTWPAQSNTPPPQRPGNEHYRRSHLYQLLCRLTGISENDSTPGLPYPSSQFLDGLELALASRGPGSKTDIDAYLSELLNSPDLLKITRPGKSRATSTGQLSQEQTALLIEQAIHELGVLGIPNFPEQYLYFIEQPQLRSYRLTPPVQVTNEILGQFDLIDATGQTICGYGEELKTALLLCAATGKCNCELPEAREDLEILLSHYQKDLTTLRTTLKDFCYSQVENTLTARKLIQRIWKKLGLPAIEMFSTI
jgi:hypothetical protein